MALAAWLFAGVLIELAGRVRLFRVSPAESWRRARRQPRSAYGMALAHAGLAIAVAGITASSAWRVESIQYMRPGDSVTVAGYEYRFDGVKEWPGPNYTAERATFVVSRGGREIVRLTPEKRTYPVSGMPTTEAGIHTTWLADLYVVLGDADGRGGWATRIYFNPLVPWIWLGAIVMFLGGCVSLSDRRHRVGAPRARAAPPAPAETRAPAPAGA
jgi:cytochrome c-type biogenesis protein CcmF